jgi:hypothetical protein
MIVASGAMLQLCELPHPGGETRAVRTWRPWETEGWTNCWRGEERLGSGTQ